MGGDIPGLDKLDALRKVSELVSSTLLCGRISQVRPFLPKLLWSLCSIMAREILTKTVVNFKIGLIFLKMES